MFTKNVSKFKNVETVLTYLEEPDVLEKEVTVIDVINGPGNEYHVITNSTPFYVKGGGQPGDTGYLYRWDEKFEVVAVGYTQEGRVIHTIKTNKPPTIFPGSIVALSVDHYNRNRNSYIHSAGELICAAIKVLGYNWRVLSAIHYPDNASVEFDVQLSDIAKEQLAQKLQLLLDEMIQKGSVVEISFHSDKDDVIKQCGYFPDYIIEGEPIRIVKVWADVYGRPCAGTHLKNINSLQRIEVTKIKNKKGLTQVRYQTHM